MHFFVFNIQCFVFTRYKSKHFDPCVGACIETGLHSAKKSSDTCACACVASEKVGLRD